MNASGLDAMMDPMRGDVIAHRTSIGAPASGERRLVEEIFFAAIHDLRSSTPEGLLYKDAHAWMLRCCYEPHGFGWVCSILGLEPSAVVKAVLAKAGTRRMKRRVVYHARMVPNSNAYRGKIRALAAARKA